MEQKKSRIKAILQYGISLLIAAALLYFVFKNVDWQTFLEKLSQVNYNWVWLSITLSLIAFVVRAYRWNILIQPLRFKLQTRRTLLAVMVGYLVNLALPRAGELSRCAILKRNDDVPLASSFGTVVTERIFDLIMLILLLGLAFLLEFDKLLIFFSNVLAYSTVSSSTLVILGVIGILAILVSFLLYKKIDQYLMRHSIYIKIRELLRDVVAGLLSFRKIENKVGFIISTVVIWVLYFYMSFVVIYALPETSGLTHLAGLAMLVGAGIALSIPVQGGFGTYHVIVSSLLLLYGIEETTGVFFATLLHTSQIATIAVFGAISMLITIFVKKRNATQE